MQDAGYRGEGHPILRGRVFTGRQPANMAPRSTYYVPSTDRTLPAGVQDWLRRHPLTYAFSDGDAYYRCCPVCEQWTGASGCDVRRLAEAGDFESAKQLHDEREWPAGTGKATTQFRGMSADYRLVTFTYADPGRGP